MTAQLSGTSALYLEQKAVLPVLGAPMVEQDTVMASPLSPVAPASLTAAAMSKAHTLASAPPRLCPAVKQACCQHCSG